jgi:hypothetical protein
MAKGRCGDCEPKRHSRDFFISGFAAHATELGGTAAASMVH